MYNLIEDLKTRVIEASKDPNFIHHDWFTTHHLDIVEDIALELLEKYPNADKDIVRTLVWIHDYPKILNKEKEHDPSMFIEIEKLMLEIGFSKEFIQKSLEYLEIMEKKMVIDLHDAPIEVRIASSADAASHFIGPFFNIYAKENHELGIEDLVTEYKRKLKKDWERKMVLPEIKQSFQERYNFLLEQAGKFPDKYID